mgnify:CR=1 FL=1
MKITYLGEVIEPKPRKINGEFKKKGNGWYMLAIAVLMMLVPIVLYTTNRVSAMVDTQVETHNTPIVISMGGTVAAKVDDLKNEVVETIAKCESGGRKEEDGIVILDSNDVGSYGVVQFQRKTVMHYYKMRTGHEINGRDAIMLAMNSSEAKDLAKWILFETDKNAWRNWYTCSIKNDISTKIEMINKFSK